MLVVSTMRVPLPSFARLKLCISGLSLSLGDIGIEGCVGIGEAFFTMLEVLVRGMDGGLCHGLLLFSVLLKGPFGIDPHLNGEGTTRLRRLS